ncbi:MAG: gliding motility-associated C-terminal domain-containing protein [Massilibacteroides sp.]|nr:gliding motility-associated C-terminal domain-containing protein [Massilibacteroides sp.]MDD3061310.1 gliding motility-associated C-terminal domain-containing protein [Massilibacteroides sp.]MDD4115834.1 gliding motility-associated C-terminal domain-containing protein [Massilibacteroides sp.]MDD4659807.1 gliding motility-associated C-terminal domain-containing protein [Massilibacteroides sp.]
MFKRRLINLEFLIFLLLLPYPVFAQYSVGGGGKTPLLAERNSANDIDVYLVYGTNGVEVSYTSSSASHQWFRYRTKASDSEPVTAQQNGTTSVVQNVEEGYGYFVKESTGFTKYIWIIDYSKYKPELNALSVAENERRCDGVTLEGSGQIVPLYYHIPSGTQIELVRKFELKYNTLEWVENDRTFRTVYATDTISGNPFGRYFPLSLYADTEFELTGDLFARYFNEEKTVISDLFTAVALQISADTTMVSSDSGFTQESDNGAFSAPLEVHFTAYANEPVANSFVWKIYLIEDSTQFMLNYRGSELDYIFEREGKYRVELTVLDRTGTCEDQSVSYDVEISDFYWDAPNAFSPGSSSGINDEFKIVYRSIVSFKGWIFNRWGNEIFHWTNPELGWDGKKGGKYVAPGVYFYVLEAKGSDGKTHKKTGSINILRSKTNRDEVVE